MLQNHLNIFFFQILSTHLTSPDWDVKEATLQLVQDLLPHLGPDTDRCLSLVVQDVVPCIGSNRINVQKTAVQVIQRYLKFTNDLQGILR